LHVQRERAAQAASLLKGWRGEAVSSEDAGSRERERVDRGRRNRLTSVLVIAFLVAVVAVVTELGRAALTALRAT
jgi:hypothetical protein